MSETVTLKNKKTGKIVTLRKKEQKQSSQTSQQAVEQKQPIQDQRPSAGGTLLRTVMRSSGVEQMKTAQYLIDKMPEPKDGESYVSYQKRVNEILKPRERELAKKGALAQLETPVMGALALSGMKNPIQTIKLLSKFALLEGIADKTGFNEVIKSINQPELRDFANISKTFLEGGLASMKWAPKVALNTSFKFAGRIINSLIRPRHREFMFGKDPGGAIVKEKIVATSMEDLGNKVQQRIDMHMKEISEIRSQPQYADIKVNAMGVIKHLQKVKSELQSKGKNTHAAEITRLDNAIKDIQESGKDLTKLTIPEAYQLKESVSSMQNWASDSVGSNIVNKGIRGAYHVVDSVIDKAIPAIKNLNSRVADLISATNAIKGRVEVLRKSEPMPTVMKVLDLPFTAMKSVLGKTLIAKMLSTERPHMTGMDLLKGLLK